MSWLAPVTLTGTHASLVPLAPEHAQALGEASNEDELWRVWYTNVPSPDGMAAEIERRLGHSLAVHADLARLDHNLGVPAGLDEALEFEELIEADRFGGGHLGARARTWCEPLYGRIQIFSATMRR